MTRLEVAVYNNTVKQLTSVLIVTFEVRNFREKEYFFWKSQPSIKC